VERLRAWMEIATHRSVLTRSLVTCGLVGTILVAINHGGRVTSGSIDGGLAVQIGLTFLVPFVVSMVSSVAAISGHRSASVRSAAHEMDPVAVDGLVPVDGSRRT